MSEQLTSRAAPAAGGSPAPDGDGAADVERLRRQLARERAARREAEEITESATRRLYDANRELETFVATVSHDLRSPVVALDGFVEALRVMLADVELPPDAELVLERMAVNTSFMAALITDLLELASVSQIADVGQTDDVGRIVEEVALSLASGHPEARVEVVGSLPRVAVSPVRLRQLLSNLVANAFAYGGRPDVTVRVSGEVEGDRALLVVSDDGVGIPTERREDVFAPFDRLGRDDKSGSGLGLAICRRVCQQAGGSIELVDSDRGACFEVRLPAG